MPPLFLGPAPASPAPLYYTKVPRLAGAFLLGLGPHTGGNSFGVSLWGHEFPPECSPDFGVRASAHALVPLRCTPCVSSGLSGSSSGVKAAPCQRPAFGECSWVTACWQSARRAYGSPDHLRQRAFCFWVKAFGSGTLPFPGVKPSCQPPLASLSGRHKGFLLLQHLAVAFAQSGANPHAGRCQRFLPSSNASPSLKLLA